eukprot:COSAG02_NODE_53998_length_298_cov_1.045226_1_plen_70_part_10
MALVELKAEVEQLLLHAQNAAHRSSDEAGRSAVAETQEASTQTPGRPLHAVPPLAPPLGGQVSSSACSAV